MRTFKLTKGVADLLGLALEYRIEQEIGKWKNEVAAGEISEDTRAAFVAFGWITPRDGRVMVVSARSAKKSEA